MWGDSVEGLRMSCGAESPKYSRTGRILIWIQIENLTEVDPMQLPENRPFRDYNVDVRRRDGKPVVWTDDGRYLYAPDSRRDTESVKVVYISPGKPYELRYPVSEFFDMTIPGRYIVEVSRPDVTDGTRYLQAPPLEITVK